MLNLSLGVGALLVAVIGLPVWLFLTRRNNARRNAGLQHLLDLADRLEADLKTCRAGLQQAHAVMALNPDMPAASEQEAQMAIDAGLRALLQQRLWIRDRAPRASAHEMNDAMISMRSARERLQPLLQALTQAQKDLNSAMRDHLRREPDA